jgi:tetratricopeptide (TPR) repeat protein
VIRSYRAAGERHLMGRAVITKAIYTHYDGRPDEAVSLFDQGFFHLDLKRDVRLAVVAVKDKAHALADCGEFEKAWQLLREVHLHEAFASDPLTLLRLRWIEGKILAGLVRLEAAQEAFTETRAGFLGLKQAYHGALVGLELAAVLLRRKRTERAAQLAKEALDTFRRLKVNREAVRALEFCERAFRQKEASAALLQRAVSFLSALEWNPRLQFQPWGPH